MALSTVDAAEDEQNPSIMAEINITPLTDVFLVLLIIFMVTSSVMSQLGVDVNLPQSSPALTKAQPESVIVTLLPRGGLKVNESVVRAGDWETMKAKLKDAFAQTKSKQVILEGDREAMLGTAIELMDHAREAGATGFAIAATPESGRK